jgi:hypothetical protein
MSDLPPIEGAGTAGKPDVPDSPPPEDKIPVPPEVKESLGKAMAVLLNAIEKLKVDEFNEAMKQHDATRASDPKFWLTIENARRREKRFLELAAELGQPPGVVEAKALALFQEAVEAERMGNRLAILNKDDEIIDEITGITSSPEVAPTSAR